MPFLDLFFLWYEACFQVWSTSSEKDLTSLSRVVPSHPSGGDQWVFSSVVLNFPQSVFFKLGLSCESLSPFTSKDSVAWSLDVAKFARQFSTAGCTVVDVRVRSM